MTLNDRFIQKAIIERSYMKLVIDKFPNKSDYKVWMTPPEGREGYDGIIFRFKKYSDELLDRMIFEIKCRDKNYNDLLLEKKKYESLLEIRENLDSKLNKRYSQDILSKLMYICVTPATTLIFDLDRLGDIQWQWEEHWKSTTMKSKGKVKKEVLYINEVKAKKIDVKIGDWFNSEAIKQMIVNFKRIKQMGLDL